MCELKNIIQEPVKPIEFNGFKCCVRLEYYAHAAQNRVAILLEDPDTGESIARASINVPEEYLNDNEVIIKDYSENEGMLSTLILAKIISVPVRFTSGSRFPICKLLLPLSEKQLSAGDNIFNAFKDAIDFINI